MKKKVLIAIICFVALILGLIVFYNIKEKDAVDEKVEAHEINIDYLKGADGKLVTIFKNLKCEAVELTLYEDNSYTLDKGTHNLREGIYDFDVVNLFGMMSSQKVTKENEGASWRVYTLTTGKGEEYISNNNNIPLNTLLEQLNINLNECKVFEVEE